MASVPAGIASSSHEEVIIQNIIYNIDGYSTVLPKFLEGIVDSDQYKTYIQIITRIEKEEMNKKWSFYTLSGILLLIILISSVSVWIKYGLLIFMIFLITESVLFSLLFRSISNSARKYIRIQLGLMPSLHPGIKFVYTDRLIIRYMNIPIQLHFIPIGPLTTPLNAFRVPPMPTVSSEAA